VNKAMVAYGRYFFYVLGTKLVIIKHYRHYKTEV
jgi:hypothetical protein